MDTELLSMIAELRAMLEEHSRAQQLNRMQFQMQTTQRVMRACRKHGYKPASNE